MGVGVNGDKKGVRENEDVVLVEEEVEVFGGEVVVGVVMMRELLKVFEGEGEL